MKIIMEDDNKKKMEEQEEKKEERKQEEEDVLKEILKSKEFREYLGASAEVSKTVLNVIKTVFFAAFVWFMAVGIVGAFNRFQEKGDIDELVGYLIVFFGIGYFAYLAYKKFFSKIFAANEKLIKAFEKASKKK